MQPPDSLETHWRYMPLADPLPIQPRTKPIRGAIRVPGSKSYTNRALPIAALAHGTSRLTGVLDSEDTQVMIAALRALGVAVRHEPDDQSVAVEGCAGRIPASSATLYLANSGTSMRFLAAVAAAAGRGTFVLDGTSRMRERPMGDLLRALRSLGVDATSLADDDCPPLQIRADGLRGGEAAVRGDVSSQFLSGLLIAAPLADAPLALRVEGRLVSQPYVEMTLAVMTAFGAAFEQDGLREFRFPGRGGAGAYVGREYAVEPDASAASYFFAAAAITAGSVTVDGLGRESLQGDLKFVDVLERMGCRVDRGQSSTTVHGAPLCGVDVDMTHISDTVPTLAAVACFASGPTRIRGVGHIRHKETDRIAALAQELRKTGCEIDEHPDGLTIVPHPPAPAVFDTYNDHRMAMALALLGLRRPGIAVRDPGCTAKTYPSYFADLAQLSES